MRHVHSSRGEECATPGLIVDPTLRCRDAAAEAVEGAAHAAATDCVRRLVAFWEPDVAALMKDDPEELEGVDLAAITPRCARHRCPQHI